MQSRAGSCFKRCLMILAAMAALAAVPAWAESHQQDEIDPANEISAVGTGGN